MTTRPIRLCVLLAAPVALFIGCQSSPTRGNSAEIVNPTGSPTEAGATATKASSGWNAPGTTAGTTGLGATGAANSTSSAAGPGTSTGTNRGGSR